MSIQTKEQQVDTFYKLTSTQIDTIRGAINRLTALGENGLVNDENFKLLTNVVQEINALREYYILRLLNGLKRGDRLGG